MTINLTQYLKDKSYLNLDFSNINTDEILVEEYSKFDKEHLDSFWYDGGVLSLKYKDREIYVLAVGEIRIETDEELIYDTKERNSGFGFDVETDKDLSKVNEDNGFYWQMNNWFDLHYKTDKDETYDFCLEMTAHAIDEAICMAVENLVNNEEFWN